MYLPLEDLAKAGCSEEDIRREVENAGKGVQSSAVTTALRRHGARAHEYFAKASASLPRRDASRFVAAEIMHKVYFELLHRIEAADYDVFSQVVRVPRPAQARIAARTWWQLKWHRT
jgi:phytoene/squalene synthetase